jgi:excisionase family DNA binding protein
LITLLAPEAAAELKVYIHAVVADQLANSAKAERAPDLMTVSESAKYLRTTPAAIYKRIKRRKLPALRPEGSQILLRRTELDHLLDLTDSRSYDRDTPSRPREAATSGAVTPGSRS